MNIHILFVKEQFEAQFAYGKFSYFQISGKIGDTVVQRASKFRQHID